MREKIVLIDGHSILNRAFFGLPDLTNSEGLHTNAVYGFLNILFKILEEEHPTHLAVAFDVKHPTFRHKMFDDYKGTRKPMAEELRQQVPLMKEMLKSMGVTIVELPGYEADDILGTISCMAEVAGMDASIVSGDRDTLQLATDHVMIRIPKTKKTGTEIENYYAKDVLEKYQVTPKEFIDVKALMGDTSDNIPGVEGIGEKTATALIAQYHSIEEVHAHAAEVKPPRAAKNIVEFWDTAVLSKTLATIETAAPVADAGFALENAKIEGEQSLYTEEAYLLCKRLEFKNFLSRFQVEGPQSKVEDAFVEITSKKEAEKVFVELNKSAEVKKQGISFVIVPSSDSEKSQEEADGQMSLFAIAPTNAFDALVLCGSKDQVYYIPTSDEVSSDWLLQQFAKIPAAAYITSDLKSQLSLLNVTEEEWAKYFDITIGAYLLNPIKNEYPYDDIAKDYLGVLVPSAKELKDDTKKKASFVAYVNRMAKGVIASKLEEQGMMSLFTQIEMPLVFVLHDMEEKGICVDAQALKEYGDKLEVSIVELEKRIYKQAGEAFNINSPKQLGVILFEKLGLPHAKKTKTGYSTSADVLDKLKQEYPIVSDILEYRQLTKLKSTYADGLANYIEADGKIHTNFNQTITATGRLSSTEPNLQNIPIRIELGRMIRRVFLPMDGYVFVDSDYSQIELRILAHLSGDETMIKAYRQEADIHKITASQVFHVPMEEVTPTHRRNAKAVNFGIVYGISAYGLSEDLGIAPSEAKEYIESYFKTYPKIKEFLDKTVADAKETGCSTTLFGRIRPIPELSSSNFMQRQFGERVAMNAPIQGTAADIIKIAMIRVYKRLKKEGLRARLLLQVHDELLIEAPIAEKEQVIALLEEEMHAAADLLVPLEVGTSWGENWYEAH